MSLILWSLGALVLACLAGKLFRRYAVTKFTLLNDLPSLGTPRQDGMKLGDTVIICGGSVTGLLSARVCTDHFSRVLIIDPDCSSLIAGSLRPDGPQNPPPHTRVMQYNAVHLTQAIYVGVMRRLFGGAYFDAVKAADCIIGPASYNAHIGNIHVSTPLETFPEAGRTAVGISRAAQETVLRGLVVKEAKDKSIEFINGTVLGFEFDLVDPQRIIGVKYRPTEDQKTVVVLKGDLILDCSGNSRVGLTCLQRAAPLINLPKSIIETYHPHMRYTSCTYPNASAVLKPMREMAGPGYELDSPFPSFFVPAPDKDTRHIGLVRVEGDKCKILAGGAGFQSKIESASELRDLAKSIQGFAPMPAWFLSVLDLLVEQEADQPGTHEHITISPMTLVKYHKHANALPRNFIALGDAWLRLNPINGQGLAKAALEATTLDATLRSTSRSRGGALDVASSFYQRIAPRVLRTWAQQKAADYKIETTEPAQGESREKSKSGFMPVLMSGFTKGIGKRLLRGDRDVASRVMRVTAWVGPPTDLFAPTVVGKILFDKALGRW